MKIGIIIGLVIAILALVVCLVPLKEVAYAVTVDYEDIETYYEEEPYPATETYTETVPLDYGVIDSYYREKSGHPCGYVEVKNIDDAYGLFIVDFSFRVPYTIISPGSILMGVYIFEGEEAIYLEPDEPKTAIYCEDNIDVNDNWSWSYTVTPGTKTVEQERTVTKYRQVEKQRTVTRQRQETRYKKVTLLDYLLHY